MANDAVAPVPKQRRGAKRVIRSFKAAMDEKRTPMDRLADFLTESFGTVFFLVLNAFIFALWILWNTGLIPGWAIIDPFPFGLLTMVVSLEAIFLAIIVLISQNREARVNELREEIELYISTYAEKEITKIIYLQTLLLEKSGVDVSHDKELQQMLKSLESDEIQSEFEKQMQDIPKIL